MRFSRLYEQTAEFRARCKSFDFAVVAQTVIEIALSVRRKLNAWWANTKPKDPKPPIKKPHQLVLALDAIAHMPLLLQ